MQGMKAKAEELKTRQIQEQGEQQRKNMEADLRHQKQRSEYEDVLARRRYEDQLAQQVKYGLRYNKFKVFKE